MVQNLTKYPILRTHHKVQLTFDVKILLKAPAPIFKTCSLEIGLSYFLINPETSLVLLVSDLLYSVVKLRSQRQERFNSVFRNNGPRDQLFTMPTPRGVITRDRSHHTRVRQFKIYFATSARRAYKKGFLLPGRGRTV